MLDALQIMHVAIAIQVWGQKCISYLANVIFWDEYVPGSQIPVNEWLVGEVRHSKCYLPGEAEQLSWHLCWEAAWSVGEQICLTWAIAISSAKQLINWASVQSTFILSLPLSPELQAMTWFIHGWYYYISLETGVLQQWNNHCYVICGLSKLPSPCKHGLSKHLI